MLEELKMREWDGGHSAIPWPRYCQHLGVSVKVAQDQLGHSNPTTTLAIYTHALPEAQKAAVSLLAAQLFPDVPKFRPNEGKAG